jgi:hypothetical protein
MPSDPYHAREEHPVAGGQRPLNQGDVFVNAPVAYGAKYPPDSGGHKARIREGPVILLTHPCSARKGGSGRLNDLLSVSPVVPMTSIAEGWGPPWDGRYALFPLPALFGGQNYAANLAQTGMVNKGFLQDQRTAVLSLDGLAAFQHRLNRNNSRINEDIERTRHRVEEYWLEFDLWEIWAEHNGTEDGFQQWLDEPSKLRPESTRRQILKFDFEDVKAELDEELAG